MSNIFLASFLSLNRTGENSIIIFGLCFFKVFSNHFNT